MLPALPDDSTPELAEAYLEAQKLQRTVRCVEKELHAVRREASMREERYIRLLREHQGQLCLFESEEDESTTR